ncbi:MAG: YfhO family protein, partial [Lachnospiraceae bacterium]|nr:YfhO family protein [Lachnospiraceae bacterium]
MTEKAKRKIDEHPCRTAFILSFLMLLIYSFIQGIYPAGRVTFLRKDLYHQYLPFLYELRRRLIEGKSLKYSFDLGLGSSFFAMYVYYLSDPLNFISVIIPERFLLEFLTFITYMKISFASASMCRYLIFRDQRIRRMIAVLFSLCYGFSGFMASYDWNVMWMWGIALAPLAIMYMEKLVKGIELKETTVRYILIMAFITWTNYYIAMIMDIFFIIYFIAVSVESFAGIKNLILSLARFAGSSILAAGMTAGLIVPEYLLIRDTSFMGNSFPREIEFYLSLPELMLRSLAGVGVETGLGHEPATYASLALLIFLPLFFMNKEILTRHKIVRALLIVFFYFSFNTNVLEFIWHGMNYPDSIPARQAFLLIIVCLTIAYESLDGIADMEKWKLMCAALFPALVFSVCFILCREESHTDEFTWIISGIFIVMYLLFMLFYIFFNEEFSGWGIYAAGMVIIFELIINFSLTSLRDIKRESYFRHPDTYRELAAQAEKLEPLNQGAFTRFDTVDENIRNISSMSGYHDASYFSSTIDNGAEDFYKKFGMKASKVHYMAEGMTPFTSAILGVHYLLADDFRNNGTDYDIAVYKAEENDDYLYECLFKLPFGYTVYEGSYSLDDGNYGASDPIERQNQVSVELGGDEVFHAVPGKYIDEDEGEAEFTVPRDGHYYAYTDADIEEITEYVDFSDEVYAEFDDMDYESIMDLGRLDEGETVWLYADEEHSGEEFDISIYRFDPVSMQEIADRLSEYSLTLTGFEEDHIEGIADMPEGRELILAYPLSAGWSVVLDGTENIEPESFYGLFMKLTIPPGVHHISLEYHIPGIVPG